MNTTWYGRYEALNLCSALSTTMLQPQAQRPCEVLALPAALPISTGLPEGRARLGARDTPSTHGRYYPPRSLYLSPSARRATVRLALPCATRAPHQHWLTEPSRPAGSAGHTSAYGRWYPLALCTAPRPPSAPPCVSRSMCLARSSPSLADRTLAPGWEPGRDASTPAR